MFELPKNQFPKIDLTAYLPNSDHLAENLQTFIPHLAKDDDYIKKLDASVSYIPTCHLAMLGDSRWLNKLADGSIDLVLTSPPYWTLKIYEDSKGQLGHIASYEEFIQQLNKVWLECFRVLKPGGRLVCVVGDVCLSRKQNNGRHTVVPLHASIQEACKDIGYDNLQSIIWHKIANANYEAKGNGAGFLGKPYEPNAVIKNDIEFILLLRKSGAYRKVSSEQRLLSVISKDNYQIWFRSIWGDITGASTRNHPAPFPEALAVRLIRMFSFVGDTVLDPFWGTGTTTIAAAKYGRNSVGIEISEKYFNVANNRFDKELSKLLGISALEKVRC